MNKSKPLAQMALPRMITIVSPILIALTPYDESRVCYFIIMGFLSLMIVLLLAGSVLLFLAEFAASLDDGSKSKIKEGANEVVRNETLRSKVKKSWLDIARKSIWYFNIPLAIAVGLPQIALMIIASKILKEIVYSHIKRIGGL